MKEYYEDTRYCDNCERDTDHLCHDSGHERDSSYDTQKCLCCGWEMNGMTGKYTPPEPEPDYKKIDAMQHLQRYMSWAIRNKISNEEILKHILYVKENSDG